ncbi:hypothetical protein TNCT_595321 [Trichonephila clavata]|uniref:Uncharacterized protein n=1 Tax=Trichonephila clavata TaxID=2740835 RepID=A0A8X6GBK7_TRICU|nr:hypothetical protein TNCT_595321 [Trichonephila clavata]
MTKGEVADENQVSRRSSPCPSRGVADKSRQVRMIFSNCCLSRNLPVDQLERMNWRCSLQHPRVASERGVDKATKAENET